MIPFNASKGCLHANLSVDWWVGQPILTGHLLCAKHVLGAEDADGPCLMKLTA